MDPPRKRRRQGSIEAWAVSTPHIANEVEAAQPEELPNIAAPALETAVCYGMVRVSVHTESTW